MLRIGLAASKIAKGNIWSYHLAVVIITCLFAIFVFFICSFSIALTLFILSLIFQRFLPLDNQQVWIDIFKTCLIFLGGILGLMALFAIVKNIKLKFKL